MTDIGNVHPLVVPEGEVSEPPRITEVTGVTEQGYLEYLRGLEQRWEARLANQKQVIANLDADRDRLRAQRDRLHTVLCEVRRILNVTPVRDLSHGDLVELWQETLIPLVDGAVEG